MTSPRPPQFSLRWLFTRMAAVSAICGATMWWVNHVRRVAENEVVSLRTIHATIFLAIILLAVVITVILVPPMCIAIAMFWPRRRPDKKDTSGSD